MTKSDHDTVADQKAEVASYIGSGRGPAENGPKQVADLLTYLEDTYPDDAVLSALAFRAWTAVVTRTAALYSASPDQPGILQSELVRAERWALYLEGKGSPDARTARSLYFGLLACFDPSTDKLEEWFVGHEAQILRELHERYGTVPEGEPDAIFN
jgi:hypothetical protein